MACKCVIYWVKGLIERETFNVKFDVSLVRSWTSLMVTVALGVGGFKLS